MSGTTLRWIGLAVLYLLASPVYLVLAIRKAITLWRARARLHAGYLACPHCGTVNALDVLATCPKCRTTEYGNRLRCTGCGERSRSFDCDACDVTIRVL